jgi:transposase-like protein
MTNKKKEIPTNDLISLLDAKEELNGCCPACNSDNVEADSEKEYPNACYMIQRVKCHECGACYSETYRIVATEII